MPSAEKISIKQHRYYRAIVLPLMREHIGCESDPDAHDQLVAGFYGIDPRGSLPSMGNMTHEEAGRFISWILRQADEGGVRIPEPRESGIVPK